ncbi:MAG: hypothetical protein CMJ46_07990 [Planctomyces sp.]|nr:hypothetical protein [Planctomyces sp.]
MPCSFLNSRIIVLASLLYLLCASVPHARADENPAAATVPSDREVLLSQGESIWKMKCAECHGANGEGVEQLYDKALAGDETVGQLAELIDRTMPEGAPEECQGDDAVAVATWIHEAFYSEAARLRNRPPRITLTHLTSNQLQQSLADLYGRFHGNMPLEEQRGLRAEYYNGSSRNKNNLKMERIDPVVNFDWGTWGPGNGISKDAFYVYWQGGLKVEESGQYEIIMRSTAAFKMDFGRFGRLFIDNHVQSGDKSEFRKTVNLLAGRVYPVKIDLYQRKRKTEQPPVSARLSWVAPHGIEEVIPERNLIPVSPPPTFALQTKLPPDDRSYGYDRGLAVDRSWDESTTLAAAEFASVAISELWPDYQRSHNEDPDENRAKLRAFVAILAETAFRGPLSDDEKKFYVDDQIDATKDDTLAIQRCLLTILKSPRFLYPELDRDRSVSQRVANRLALVLFDSLPSDKVLLDAVSKNELETDEQIRQMAERMVNDYRCEGKMHEMLFEWLNLSHIGNIAKDSEQFPNFNKELVADLRTSLKLTLDEAVIDGESDFRQLFDANWLYTNSRLADFYGDNWTSPATEPEAVKMEVKESSSDSPAFAERPPHRASEDYYGLLPVNSFVKSEASPPYNRGILSHPYLMSGLAYNDTSSPIHRGVFLIRYMLGRTLRPPNAAFTPLSADLHPELTTRERVALQTGEESCQVCHSKINGLGFTLEGFDAVGRFREMEGEKPINSHGSYIDRNGQTISFNNAKDVAEYMAGSDDAHRAFVHRAFQHFVKQPAAAYNPAAMDELINEFRSDQFDLRKLVVDVAVVAANPTYLNPLPPASPSPDSTTSN